MENVKFGEFRLDSVMNISSSKAHINKNALQSSDLGGDIPYVTRSTSNNGVSDYIKRYLDDETYLNAARQITIAMDTYVMYYQSEAFYTGNRVKVGVPTFEGYSDNMAEYLITAFNKAVEAFSWGHNMNADQLEAIKITLPMIDDETPDWEYMDNYIKGVKARRLKIIEDFVDKELTEIVEMKILEDVEFGEFNVRSFIDIAPTKAYPLGDSEILAITGDTPFITTTTTNNGTVGHTGLKANNLGMCITASDTTVADAMFFQEFDFVGRSHVQALRLKEGVMSRGVGEYLVTAMIKSAGDRFSYGSKFNRDAMYALDVVLPMIDPETPDWDFMDSYMQRIESEKKDLIRQFVENAGGGSID